MLDNIELINFIDLSEEEKLKVLSWRNDERIRKWMYNSEIIKKENHLNFINTLNNSKDKLYFLVKENNKDIGVIDYVDIKDSSAHMGIYSNPDLKGMGEILLDIIIQYGFNTLNLRRIIAEVYTINDRAYSLYKRKGFIDIGRKDFNGNNISVMELTYEN